MVEAESSVVISFLWWKISCLRGHMSGLFGGEVAAHFSSCSSSFGRRGVGAKAASWWHACVWTGFVERIRMAWKGTRERGGSWVGLVLIWQGGGGAAALGGVVRGGICVVVVGR